MAELASPMEQVLAQTWAELLGVERVGRHDNFFELGGDSILAMQAIARARQAGLDLAVKQLFQAPTVAGLAALAMQAQSDGGSGPAAEQGLVAGSAPLTPIQRWFFDTAAGNPSHFNQSVLIETPDGLDPAGLRQVLAALLAHHDALRLRFTSTAQGWSQDHGSVEGDVPLVSIDLSELSGPELATALDTHAAAAQTSLDIAQGPLLRMVHFQLGQDVGDLLLIAVHHLAMDGVSWRILLEDLQTAYRQALEGSAIALLPKTTAFRTWALRLAEYGQADAVQDELGYWRKMGTAAGRAEPPSGRAAASDPARWPLTLDLPGTEADAAIYQVTLGRDETAALLREVPAAYGADVSEALLTALARAYGLVSGWPGLFVDMEGHGREPLFADVDLTRTVGWFTTQYPVWLAWRDAGSDELAPEPGGWHPGRALMAVKERMRSVPNRGIGYGMLRYLSRDPEIAQTLAALPQPAISLNYLGQFGSGREDASPGPVFRISARPRGPERDAEMPLPHLLEVSAAVQEGQLWLAWTYNSRRLELADVQHLAQETIRALQELVAHSSTPEAADYTPSDFPQAGLTQAEIDALMEEIGH